MCNILIVDDEKKERKGIALLLKRFEFPLRTAFAQNWRRCAENNGKNYFDILLTEQKYPIWMESSLCVKRRKRG